MQMKVSNVGLAIIKPSISFKKFEHSEELFKKNPVIINKKPDERLQEELKWKTRN